MNSPRCPARDTDRAAMAPREPVALCRNGIGVMIRFRRSPMLAIVAILVVLWLLGIVTKNTLGGALHILLVVAIIFGLIGLIRGRGLGADAGAASTFVRYSPSRE